MKLMQNSTVEGIAHLHDLYFVYFSSQGGCSILTLGKIKKTTERRSFKLATHAFVLFNGKICNLESFPPVRVGILGN